VVITGQPHLVIIEFAPQGTSSGGGSNNSTSAVFALTFQEAGLKSSPNWNLTLDGVATAVATVNLTVDLSVGVHSFAVNASGYSANPASGAAASQGSSYLQQIGFTLLPAGGAPPAATSSGIDVLSFLTSPFLLVGLASGGTWAGRQANRRARRKRYHRWFEEEVVRIQADRTADVARELAMLPAMFRRTESAPFTRNL
jgi:hypothetical protein